MFGRAACGIFIEKAMTYWSADELVQQSAMPWTILLEASGEILTVKLPWDSCFFPSFENLSHSLIVHWHQTPIHILLWKNALPLAFATLSSAVLFDSPFWRCHCSRCVGACPPSQARRIATFSRPFTRPATKTFWTSLLTLVSILFYCRALEAEYFQRLLSMLMRATMALSSAASTILLTSSMS